MDDMDKLLLLMDLRKDLRNQRYDALNLMNLDLLRIEVEKQINVLNQKNKVDNQ